MKTVTYQGLKFVPYIKKDEIMAQVQRVAMELTRDLKDAENPLFLVVLNGSFMFAADLYRNCNLPNAEISFVRYKSYSGLGTTGNAKLMGSYQTDLSDRDVIIVEDIVDTGYTAEQMLKDIEALSPRSVKFVTLLYKPESNLTGFCPDYWCFEIPSKFILGYGLDLDEKGRGLDEIYVLADEADE